MAIVVEVISQLENYAITKEALEVMRNLNMIVDNDPTMPIFTFLNKDIPTSY